MGDAQDMEMEGSSDYDEENSSQISSNITHHTSKKQQNEDNRHGKSNDSNNQNGTSGGKKKNRALLLAQQNSATDRLSNRELNKIKQQIDRLEHQNKRNKKKRLMPEKKQIQSDSSLEETSKKEQQPQTNPTLQSSSSTSQVKVKQEVIDANESKNLPITLTKEKSQQSSQKPQNNVTDPKLPTFQPNNPKQNHNPLGIIITEDDSEVSASCDQLDEVEKPQASYNNKTKNSSNNNTNSNNKEIINSQNSQANQIAGKISPTGQLNTANAAEPVIKKKRKYERKIKEDNNFSKQGSQDSPVSSIQVISTTNEVKSNTKIPSRSGSATLIAPINQLNSINSSEAVVSLIPRKQTISSENQIPFTSSSNTQQLPSHQVNEAPNNSSQHQLQKSYNDSVAFSTNNIANPLLSSSAAKQISNESSFQKTGESVSSFSTQNQNLPVNGIKNDSVLFPNTNLPQSQSTSLNEQIQTLSNENNGVLQRQGQKRQKISKEEKSLSSSVAEPNFTAQQSQKAHPLQNSDEIQAYSQDNAYSFSQKPTQISGQNGDSKQIGTPLAQSGEQNSMLDNSSTGMIKPSTRTNELVIKSKIKRGPLQGGAYEDQPDLFLSLNSYQVKLQQARQDMTAKFFEEYIEDQKQKLIVEQAQQGLFPSMASVLQKQRNKSYLCPKPIFSPKGNKIFLTYKPSETLLQHQQVSNSGSQESISSELSINPAQDVYKSRVRKAENSFLLDQTSLLQETIVKKFKAQNFQEATKDPFSPLLNDFAASYLDPSYCQKVLSDFKRHQEFNESLENQDIDIEY